MDIVLIMAFILQAGVFLYVFTMLKRNGAEHAYQNEQYASMVNRVLETVTKTFMEQLTKVETTHFEQMEKQSSKQLQILEKQTKDFLNTIATITETMQPPVEQIKPFPDLLDKTSRENTIEEEQPKDYFLDEISRIPNINEMNVKFIDNEQILGEDIDTL